MAKCPKCGTKLKLTDISPNCPECGVNLRLYDFEEKFYREAKTAELSQAGWSCRIRRLKMSLIGTPLTKARLAVMLLPVLALLVPAGNITLSMPFKETQLSIGLIGLINLFTGSDLNLISAFASGGAEQEIFSFFRLTLFLYIATALFTVLVLLFNILCFISIRKMQKVICTFSVIGIVSAVVTQVMMFILTGKLKDSVMLSGSSGFGLYVVILMFAVVFAVNFLIEKKGINVEYPEGMVERCEIWEKVKVGEVKIDDLPYPVVKTAETEKIRAEIQKQRESFADSQNKTKEAAVNI